MEKLEEALRFLKVLDDFLAGASLSARGVEERCGLPAVMLSGRIASVRAAADALRVDLQAQLQQPRRPA